MGNTFRTCDQVRVQNDPAHVVGIERVVVRPKVLSVLRQGLLCGLIAYVVIASYVVNRNLRIQFTNDASILRDLLGVARTIHEITADNHEGGLQSIDAGDHECKVGLLLQSVLIPRVHAHLRISHVHEKLRPAGARGTANQYHRKDEKAFHDPGLQNWYRSATWTIRGSPAAVIFPKVDALLTFAPG